MKDVGLAVLQPDFEPEFETGYLSEVFGREGGSTQADIEAEMDAHLLTVEDILRAEHNLGHALDDVKDIEDLHLELTSDKEDHHTGKVYEYGRIDVIKEQSGAHSDGDVTTAGGYMKRNNMDPEAHQKNVKRQQQYAKLIQQLTDQELMQNRINAIMANIDHYNRQINEIDEALEILETGDLDQNTVQGRANIRAVRATMEEHGLDPNDPRYQTQDGTFNAEQAREDLERIRQEKIELRDQEISKLPEEQRAEVMERLNKDEYRKQETVAADNSVISVDAFATQDVQGATYVVQAANANIGLDDLSVQNDFDVASYDAQIAEKPFAFENNDSFDAAFAKYAGNDDLFADFDDTATTDPEMAAATEDTRSYGSFAAEGDGQTSVITAEFSAASNPELAAVNAPEQTTEPTFEQQSPALKTMSI